MYSSRKLWVWPGVRFVPSIILIYSGCLKNFPHLIVYFLSQASSHSFSVAFHMCYEVFWLPFLKIDGLVGKRFRNAVEVQKWIANKPMLLSPCKQRDEKKYNKGKNHQNTCKQLIISIFLLDSLQVAFYSPRPFIWYQF